MHAKSIRTILLILLIIVWVVGNGETFAGERVPWQTTIDNAKGKIVRLNAWGGSVAANSYIEPAQKL